MKQYKKRKQDQTLARNKDKKGARSGLGSQYQGAGTSQLKFSSEENTQLLLKHVNNMYRAAIRRFPSSSALRIQYGLFLVDRMRNQTKGLAELREAAKYNPPFDEQFIIYRYQLMSEDMNSSSNSEQGGAGVDIIGKFAYESNLRNF